MVQGSVSVNFVKTLASEVSSVLSLSLDDKANAGISTFSPASPAFLRLATSLPDDEYILNSSAGIFQIESRRIPYNIESEIITFAMQKTATLGYLPDGAVGWAWQGNDGGQPLFAGRNVLLGETVAGVLKCSYITLGDRLSLSYDGTGTVVAVVSQGGKTASVSVGFESPSDPEPVAYEMEVVDYCTDLPIPGATVYLDGAETGQTDSQGIISLGGLIPGKTYNIEMYKTGYVDSPLDHLNNDSFTVPDE